MAYEPAFRELAPDQLGVNLMAYFQATQADALEWAGHSDLIPIQEFTNSAVNRNIPAFPNIGQMENDDLVEYGNDILPGLTNTKFEVNVAHADPTTAVEQAKVYKRILVSMILNCPPAQLATGTGATLGTIICQQIETAFSEIKTNAARNHWMQTFQIRAAFTMSAGAYE